MRHSRSSPRYKAVCRDGFVGVIAALREARIRVSRLPTTCNWTGCCSRTTCRRVENQVERLAMKAKPLNENLRFPLRAEFLVRRARRSMFLLTAWLLFGPAWLPCRDMKRWRYGLTLLPRETGDEDGSEVTVEAVVRSRQDLGWELVRVRERTDSEVLVFRRPA